MDLFDSFKFTGEDLVTQRQITEWINHFLQPIPMSLDILQDGECDDDELELVDNFANYVNDNSKVLVASRYIYRHNNSVPLIKITHKNSPDDIVCYVETYQGKGRIWTDVAEDDGIYETLSLNAAEFVNLMANTTSINDAQLLIDSHPDKD